MVNHGAIAYAPDLAAAGEHSLLLEWACTVYWRARVLGDVRELDEEQRQAVVAAAIERRYGTTRPVGEADS